MDEVKKTVKEQSFESALKRLEEIVGKLEGGEMPLDKSIDLFEEGVKTVKTCMKKLEDAEARVKLVQKGLGTETDFDGN